MDEEAIAEKEEDGTGRREDVDFAGGEGGSGAKIGTK